jgi:hypothetical protein
VDLLDVEDGGRLARVGDEGSYLEWGVPAAVVVKEVS